MNRRSIIAAFFALVFLGGQSTLAQSGYDLFQKGLVQERAKGNLDEAIRLYQQIVEDFAGDRALAAKALVQMGGCYERLGKQEAQKAYQRVIEEYPGQKQEVTVAKARIAAISKELKSAAQRPTFRKIKIASKPRNGVLSPDGNKLAFISEGAVWVVPLHGKVDPDIAGEPVRLAEVPRIWDNGSLMAWSTDGEWIAVNTWPDAEDVFVYVIPAAGGEPRVVQMPKRGSHAWSYRLSLSPDGQMLAFSALELRKPRQKTSDKHDRYICTIPTAGGEPKQLSSGWGRMPSFSPDGETIAYVDGVRKNWQGTERYLLGGELWIVPSEGGTPVKLASVEGRLRGPVWSPDGKYIAAHHEPGGNNASKEIWVFPVSSDASSAGEPEKIALPHSSWNMLAGWTPEGQLGVFLTPVAHWAGYTVPASGGKAVQITPESTLPYYPRWSPDGERIYFRGDGDKNALVSYVPAAGGNVGKVPLQMEQFNSTVPGGGHNISPDGKRIVMSASHDIWTITLDGGLPTRLTNDDSHEAYPCWSPDGEWVAFVDEVNYAIYIIPAGGGEIRQVSSESDRVGGGAIAFSPDGERIAFFSGGSIKTIPVEGGESQVLVDKVKSGQHSQLAYSPDGSKIAHNAVGKIWITSLDGGEPQELSTGLPKDARLSEFGWSPDGEKIVFLAMIGGEAEFWLMENFLPKIEPKVKAVRQVWDYARMGGRGNMGRPSPDGRYLLYADMKSINVCALEFATKKMHFITNEKVPWTISDNPSKKPVEFHWGGSIWSPDGKKVAYAWRKFKNVFVFNDAWDQKRNLKDSFKELRITGLGGSNTRVLYSDDNLLKVEPLDWSSDGKHILAEFIREDSTRQLVMISVADDSVRVLKTFDKLPRRDGLRIGDLFSPDGRHVVFDSWQKDSSKQDIHILSTDGSREAVLVEHPADDFILGWTPDGKCLIFASDRTGNMSIWAIRVSEGRSQGDAVLIKKDVVAIWPKGFDKNGSFYYASETKVSDVYMAEIDFETNRILSKPKRISERFVGSAMYSDFSPDGKYIAYISYPGTAGQDFLRSNPVLCIRSLENGKEREIYPELGYIGGTCWSPDGRFILTFGKKEGRKGFYKVDVKTGEFTSILQFNNGGGVGAPVWSQDGRKLFYTHADPQKETASIIMYDLASEEKKEIHRDNFQRRYAAGRPPLFAQELALSPDGQFLAFKVHDRGHTALKIVPVSGGEAREVVQWNGGKIITTADWTPDGKELLFAESEFQRGHKFNFWRISVEGGEPQKLGLATDRIYFLRIHPNGQHIAFRAGQRVKEIYAMDNFLPEATGDE